MSDSYWLKTNKNPGGENSWKIFSRYRSHWTVPLIREFHWNNFLFFISSYSLSMFNHVPTFKSKLKPTYQLTSTKNLISPITWLPTIKSVPLDTLPPHFPRPTFKLVVSANRQTYGRYLTACLTDHIHAVILRTMSKSLNRKPISRNFRWA